MSAECADQLGCLAQYECLHQVASGGSSDVYLVRHTRSGELYAMKVLRCPADQPYTRQTLHARREQYILRLLKHPFICELHDTFHDNEHLYLVLQFHSGGTIDDIRVLSGGTISEDSVRFYAAEMVLALEYVHTMGFVYRDLKPQNVLIAVDGHIKLTDFGVAHEGVSMDSRWMHFHPAWLKPLNRSESGGISTAAGSTSCDDEGVFDVTEPELTEAKHGENTVDTQSDKNHDFIGIDDRVTTRSNSFVGSIDYMAPEMIRQQDTQTSDLDWWSLGCTLFELLYGVPPFQLPSTANDSTPCPTNVVFRRILTGTLIFPRSPPVSASCKSLIRELLSVDSSKRLGHQRGSTDVKNHRFFYGVQWAMLYHAKPPVRPLPKCLACQEQQQEQGDLYYEANNEQSEWASWRRAVCPLSIACSCPSTQQQENKPVNVQPRRNSIQRLLSLLKIDTTAL